MKQTLTLFNYHPPKTNELLGNYHKAGRLKKKCNQIVGLSAIEQGIKKAIGKRIVKITIIIPYGTRGRTPDADAFYKATWDALTHAGLLKDDSTTWCQHYPTDIIKGATKKTIIELTDID